MSCEDSWNFKNECMQLLTMSFAAPLFCCCLPEHTGLSSICVRRKAFPSAQSTLPRSNSAPSSHCIFPTLRVNGKSHHKDYYARVGEVFYCAVIYSACNI